jgi:hypothetical protein
MTELRQIAGNQWQRKIDGGRWQDIHPALARQIAQGNHAEALSSETGWRKAFFAAMSHETAARVRADLSRERT